MKREGLAEPFPWLVGSVVLMGHTKDIGDPLPVQPHESTS